jgi:hypothetical protein
VAARGTDRLAQRGGNLSAMMPALDVLARRGLCVYASREYAEDVTGHEQAGVDGPGSGKRAPMGVALALRGPHIWAPAGRGVWASRDAGLIYNR